MTEITSTPTQPYENPYATLGLDRTATPDEIKQAYFALVRLHPPEREPDAFKRIRAAYDRLRTPEARLDADMRLLEEWPQSARTARPPALDLAPRAEDVLMILEADTELARTDFHQDFREVSL